MNYLTDIQIGTFTGPGTGPLANPSANPGGTLTNVISLTIGVITAVAFIYFIYQLFSGALSVITSGSDKAKIEGARKKIFSAIIGVVVVVSAIFIIDLVGQVLGVDILDPTALLNSIP
jgi:hypothetical protein